MREIKFRGKCLSTGEWVYGYYQAGKGKNPHVISWWTVQQHEGDIWDEIDVVEVDPETVGQYTGLKDRNGKDICEGDIGEGEHALYLIKWNREKAQYQAEIIKTKSVLIKHCSFPLWQYVEDDGKCRVEVIGNIYENPSLLEVTHE